MAALHSSVRKGRIYWREEADNPVRFSAPLGGAFGGSALLAGEPVEGSCKHGIEVAYQVAIPNYCLEGPLQPIPDLLSKSRPQPLLCEIGFKFVDAPFGTRFAFLEEVAGMGDFIDVCEHFVRCEVSRVPLSKRRGALSPSSYQRN